MVTIALKGAEFFAYHGFYPEEQKLGCKFIVDVEVDFTPVKNLADNELATTVDYEQLYNIVNVEIKITRKLIETVAQAIAGEIKHRFPFSENIRVSIKKMNPPLMGKVDYSSVVITI